MNKTTKIILTTVIASAVLGGAGVVKASDDEVVNKPVEDVQPPVVDDKPVVPEQPKEGEKPKDEVKPTEPTTPEQPPVVDDKPKPEENKDKEKETEKPKEKDSVEKEKEKEKEKENKPELKPEEEKKAEENKKDILENKKDNTKTLKEFNNVVDITKDKEELKGVIENTDKLTLEQKQVLGQKLQNANTSAEIKEVKELAKTGEATTILSSLLGALGLALAGLLKKVR